jgi:hypothetical protein
MLRTRSLEALVTATETTVAAVTVSDVVPEMAPNVAEMLAAPTPTALARPLFPAALLMVAAEELAEAHVTKLVRSCVVLSE